MLKIDLTIFQKGFNYSQDGPGNRLVYHLKGCNMHCPWCSNPEGMYRDTGESTVVSVGEITDEVLSCVPMFFDGGGVTFTGGEATVQFEALEAVLRSLKEHGIDTAIETNGTSPKLSSLFTLLDHLIMDLKHPDEAVHRAVTGVSNSQVKSNITAAVSEGRDVLVRIPLIGGFNTDEAAFEGFLSFFKALPAESFRVELLKYHEYGKDKWKKLCLPYTVKDAFVEESTRRDLEEKLKKAGITTVRT